MKSLGAPRRSGKMLAGAMMLGLFMPVPAQDIPSVQVPPGAQARQAAPEEADDAAERRRLNEAQARFAAGQLADYEARKKAIADEDAAQQRAYRQALAEREVQIAATNAKAAADRAQWEADVRACQSGHYEKCAPMPVVAAKPPEPVKAAPPKPRPQPPVAKQDCRARTGTRVGRSPGC